MSTPASADRSRAATELDLDVEANDVVDANDLRDTGGDSADPGDTSRERTELPLEADPADVVEQDASVPYDDEER